MLAAEAPPSSLGNHFIGSKPAVYRPAPVEPAELKPLLTEVHVSALNRAKAEENIAVDLSLRFSDRIFA